MVSFKQSFALPMIAALLPLVPLAAGDAWSAPRPPRATRGYELTETRALVDRVNDAARLVQRKGEAAFDDFRRAGSKWRQGEAYIFVLDPRGLMVVHPDPSMEGKDELALKDVGGRLIVRGLIDTVTAVPGKKEGFYHYEWPVPGGLLPRWKSSYVKLVQAPSGARYIVGSGVYNDRMERSFVVDMVKEAVGEIEAKGTAAWPLFSDRTGRFLAKDAYIFVVGSDGTEIVNPAFPNLEGRNLLDVKDTHGKRLVREMLDVVKRKGSGWVDYMWPRPGESVSTRKSTYVTRARLNGGWVLVGAGVYLPGAPQEVAAAPKLTAPELMKLVDDGAALLQQRGEAAYPQLREKGSKWFHDDVYFIVWRTDGTRTFHAADPTLEGKNASGAKDILGRPYGQMFLDVANSPAGEGWVHYMFPEPGNLFPTWKSTFVKRVTFPSGEEHIVACGIYNMKMDKVFIEDIVNRAASLVKQRGRGAFDELRDKKGPFFFMDTYVFVDTPDGIEVVNPAQPTLEGKDVSALRDVNGKAVAHDYIAAAMKNGSAWTEYAWYKRGENTPTRKQAFVRRVQAGDDTFIVGSGLYLDKE